MENFTSDLEKDNKGGAFAESIEVFGAEGYSSGYARWLGTMARHDDYV